MVPSVKEASNSVQPQFWIEFWWQSLRLPLTVVSASSDTKNALARLSLVFKAEIRTGTTIDIDNGLCNSKTRSLVRRSLIDREIQGRLQQWKDLPHYACTTWTSVAVIGSGKSSPLSGLIGEIRKVSVSVTFGGLCQWHIALMLHGLLTQPRYASPTRICKFVNDLLLRDNILFGQEFNKERYWRVVGNCSLLPNLELLAEVIWSISSFALVNRASIIFSNCSQE